MKNENLIITGFIGFTVGVLLMMLVNTNKEIIEIERDVIPPPGEVCYEIIEEIEFQVCEECWYNVFECGDKYEEVKDYVNGK
jgi:hypothetical protein